MLLSLKDPRYFEHVALLERKAALLDEAIQALHETRLINLCEKIEAVLKKAEALKGEKP
jgi:exonuclease VII small subunit